jgi:hypothetical protein
LLSGVRNFHAQALELHVATVGTGARTPGWCSDSKLCALTGGVISPSLSEELVQSSGSRITLNLLIPLSPVMFEEPVSKLSELSRRQTLDLLFDCLNFCHVVPQSIADLTRTQTRCARTAVKCCHSATYLRTPKTPTRVRHARVRGLAPKRISDPFPAKYKHPTPALSAGRTPTRGRRWLRAVRPRCYAADASCDKASRVTIAVFAKHRGASNTHVKRTW